MLKFLVFLYELLLFYIQYVILGTLIKYLFFKTKVYYEDDSRQNKKIKEGAIFISNHRSFLDGLVISFNYFFNRWHFITENFYKERLKIVKFILKMAGGILVDKDYNNFDFIEDCKKIINKGRPIFIFPEGGQQYGYEPSKFYTGYILLALNTGAKIVPVANDFNYGLFKRVHILIGNSIDLSEYAKTELTWAKRKEINKEIQNKYLMLFYQLKKRKAEKFKFKYKTVSDSASLIPGDVIRIPADSSRHYGIYFSNNEVIHFKELGVASISLEEFCGTYIPEVRCIKKRFLRKTCDIEKYAKSCLGQNLYDKEKNNCLDFVNRVTLNI